MSKILQVRRGTADAHNNFTGMIGEISYDTDAKTLRVHDGETLGGFELARTDQIPTLGEGADTNGMFDITKVSDDFWREKFAQFAPASLTLNESPQIKLNMESGVDIGGYLTKPCTVTLADEREGRITLTEGKYHQIKLMMEAVHNQITYLERITFGPLSLDPALERGEWRELTDAEITALNQS